MDVNIRTATSLHRLSSAIARQHRSRPTAWEQQRRAGGYLASGLAENCRGLGCTQREGEFYATLTVRWPDKSAHVARRYCTPCQWTLLTVTWASLDSSSQLPTHICRAVHRDAQGQAGILTGSADSPADNSTTDPHEDGGGDARCGCAPGRFHSMPTAVPTAGTAATPIGNLLKSTHAGARGLASAHQAMLLAQPFSELCRPVVEPGRVLAMGMSSFVTGSTPLRWKTVERATTEDALWGA